MTYTITFTERERALVLITLARNSGEGAADFLELFTRILNAPADTHAPAASPAPPAPAAPIPVTAGKVTADTITVTPLKIGEIKSGKFNVGWKEGGNWKNAACWDTAIFQDVKNRENKLTTFYTITKGQYLNIVGIKL